MLKAQAGNSRQHCGNASDLSAATRLAELRSTGFTSILPSPMPIQVTASLHGPIFDKQSHACEP